jgi:very-short-patch-repair endonuclease
VTEGEFAAMKAEALTRARAKRMRREMTRAETILWTRLRRRQLLGLQFRRQLPIGPFIVDFACAQAKLVVEVDGGTHGTDSALAYDERRRAFLAAQGWSVLRVWNSDVYDNEDGVVAAIMERVRHVAA